MHPSSHSFKFLKKRNSEMPRAPRVPYTTGFTNKFGWQVSHNWGVSRVTESSGDAAAPFGRRMMAPSNRQCAALQHKQGKWNLIWRMMKLTHHHGQQVLKLWVTDMADDKSCTRVYVALTSIRAFLGACPRLICKDVHLSFFPSISFKLFLQMISYDRCIQVWRTNI